METVDTAEVGAAVPVDALRSTLEGHPVRLAILFGSRARGDTHSRSDVDIVVEFDGLRPGDERYNEAFFGLGADLSETLETDDVDLLEVHSLSPPLARAVFEDGILLFGSAERVEELREELPTSRADGSSPRERFDEALRRIDDHLA